MSWLETGENPEDNLRYDSYELFGIKPSEFANMSYTEVLELKLASRKDRAILFMENGEQDKLACLDKACRIAQFHLKEVAYYNSLENKKG